MINSTRITEIMKDCLMKEDEIDGDSVKNGIPHEIITGAMGGFAFQTDRISEYKAEINEFLLQLPEQFMKSIGGGWSFLNACIDKDGHQWGEQMNVNELMVLGAAAKLVSISSKSMWSMFPGGMPYFTVLDKEEV